MKEHVHKCKECGERVPVACVEPLCDEGSRWVVLCLRCYEHLVEMAEAEIAG